MRKQMPAITVRLDLQGRKLHLHELEGGLEVLHGVHLDAEELDAHDEADGALKHGRALLLLPKLFQLRHELLLHGREPAAAGMIGAVSRCMHTGGRERLTLFKWGRPILEWIVNLNI